MATAAALPVSIVPAPTSALIGRKSVLVRKLQQRMFQFRIC